MDNPFKSPSIISFCPGILGIERGLKRAGVHPRVVAYVEIEAYIIANLVAGMEAGILDPAPIWTDAKTFDASPFRGRIHGIVGGYPCTPFSLAGTRSGEDHPGHIYPSISRTVEATRPVWCLFENVDDHLTLGFDKVYQDLQRMGYRVEAGVYSAEEVGATHERQRLFILALDDTKGIDWRLQLRSWGSFEGEIDTTRASKELGDTYSSQRRSNIADGNKSNRNYSEWEKATSGFESSGKKTLADFISPGLEGFGARKISAEQEIPMSSSGSYTQWPAGQGIYQYDWEEPRTIESGLGSTINGYDFRDDILRALGNSVVEQTAELAFIDLLHKHLKNL